MKRPCRHSFREVLNLVEIFYVSFSSKDFTTFSGPVKRLQRALSPTFSEAQTQLSLGSHRRFQESFHGGLRRRHPK
jgi:hypothetical protein